MHFPATFGAIILLGSINLSAANKDTCDLHAAVGKSVTVPFGHSKLSNEDILRWTHGKNIIFYRQRGRVSVGRPDDISADGSLVLKNFQDSNAGTYLASLLHPNGTLANTRTVNLCVMKKVSKPKLTYECDSKSPAVNLNCEIANPQDLVFSWTLDGNTLTGEKKQTLSVSVADLRGEGSFTCTVANKVSQEKSDTVRPACKRPSPTPPALSCFKPKTLAAILASGAGLILVLLIIIIALCINTCKKNETKPQSKEEIRMLSVNERESESAVHEYETMRVSERPGSENRPEQLSTAAEGLRPSPVPKPRTKNHQTPNN